jgi:hypothetical protein
MQTAAPSKNKLGALYGRRSGINGAKSCILSLSWHLISLLKIVAMEKRYYYEIISFLSRRYYRF